MAIEYTIKRKGIFKKPFKLEEIKNITENHFNFISQDDYFRLDDEIDEKNLIVYVDKQIGRGFHLAIDNFELRISMNYFSTDTDVNATFDFMNYFMNLKIEPILIEDGRTLNMQTELEVERQNQLEFNRHTLSYEQVSGTSTIFAVMNPINVDFDQWKDLDNVSRMLEYSKYLDSAQNFDYYYMSPLFYKDKSDEHIIMRYVLTSTVVSVIPKEAYLPYGFTDDIFEVALPNAEVVFFDYDKREMIGSLPYKYLFNYLDSYEPYDESCVLIQGLSSERMRDIINEYERKV